MQKFVIDVYGADSGPEPIIRGTARAVRQGLDFSPVFVGNAAEINRILADEGIEQDRYEIIDTDDFITQAEPPHAIFGGRHTSSLALALDRLKADEQCTALLSAGSTGALLVGSVCRLGLFEGLRFPALASALPCGRDNLVCLVDCGANVDCTEGDLVRFAKMGDAFAKCYLGIESPRVALLSVGREAGKGNTLIKNAHQSLAQLPINFIGNAEGSDLVSGYADVIVADGFSGNIILKATEAAGRAAMELVKAHCTDAEALGKINDALYRFFDFNSQGGATFLGPKKTVVKMHGCANESTTTESILQILRLNAANFTGKIAEALK